MSRFLEGRWHKRIAAAFGVSAFLLGFVIVSYLIGQVADFFQAPLGVKAGTRDPNLAERIVGLAFWPLVISTGALWIVKAISEELFGKELPDASTGAAESKDAR